MTGAGGRPHPQGELRAHANFGGNQVWRSRCYRPEDEKHVLEILDRHRAGQIRPLGSGHSWSEIAVSRDVSLDMSGFDEFATYTVDGETFVRAGAGLRLQQLLERLHATTDRTLPTLGAIKRQTIAGAISTATHGSGRQGMSHFVTGLRAAAYEPTSGSPMIFEYSSGDDLRAARCSLGCMGVIVSVDMQTVPKYLIEEKLVKHTGLASILARYRERPLTQFMLVPYAWTYLAWERGAQPRRVRSLSERIRARLFRLINAAFVDVAFHLLLKGGLWLGAWASKALMRLVPALLIRNVARVDEAIHVLTLGHHYFQHEEMELFVPEARLSEAIDLLRCATEIFAGETEHVPDHIAQRLRAIGLYDELVASRSSYVQHYPFFIRRVMPEDTLISMAAREEACCSISIFTYFTPGERDDYYRFCSWLARCMNKLVDAGLHWGKHFPLSHAEIARIYPHLESFKQICRRTDPHGLFRSDYTGRVLNL
jgi:L-gulono-1,4-lactone dehydrogenase